MNVQMMVHLVIFSLRSGQLELLLVPEGGAGNLWSLPGRPVQATLSCDETASQELEERTGRHDAYLEQLYTYGEPGRNPTRREIAIVYFALLPVGSYSTAPVIKDAGQAAWFPVESLPDLALDYESIITYALRRLRYKLEYSAVGFELLPGEHAIIPVMLHEAPLAQEFSRRLLEEAALALLKQESGKGLDPIIVEKLYLAENWILMSSDVYPPLFSRSPHCNSNPAITFLTG